MHHLQIAPMKVFSKLTTTPPCFGSKAMCHNSCEYRGVGFIERVIDIIFSTIHGLNGNVNDNQQQC